MNPIARRLTLAAAATTLLVGVVQLPLVEPTAQSQALTGAGAVTELQITGRAGVPNNASAVVLNLTALDASTAGYVTAYPCGSTLPDVSNLNYTPGTAIANAATVPIGTGGKVCLYTDSAINLIADINGWYPANSDFTPTTPTRLLDTRPNRTGNRSITELQITGRAGVPNNASAVVLNLTALDASTAGYVTAYPCGSTLPDVSNLNYTPGTATAIANAATVPIGTGGKVCLYTDSAINLIADINGWYPANSDFTPTTPTRLLDTRPNRTGNRSITELQITGRAGVPNNASAVVLNLTALDASTAGYVTAYPCGSTLPDVSNLNYTPGTATAIANAATVPIGTGGKVCLYTDSAINLIADINGWYPANSDFTPTTPTRLLDTRTQAAPGPAPAPTPTGQFVETFTGNTGLERFDYGIYHRDEFLMATTSWTGDHDLNCGTPDTQRLIQRSNPASSFYLCRDHLMTAVGDTAGYSIAWFSPKQSFASGTQVSWDVNVTDLGARQWWEVAIVPTSFNSGVPSCPQCAAQEFTKTPAGVPGYPKGSIIVGDGAYGKDVNISTDGVNRNVSPNVGVCSIDPEGCASKAIRRTFSITDNKNGTVTVNYGGFKSFTVPGSFPAGGFDVVFKDHNYTPDKDGKPVGHTWHWDNIVVR